MKKVTFLFVFAFISCTKFAQDNTKLLDSINNLFTQHKVISDKITLINHIEIKNDSIEIRLTSNSQNTSKNGQNEIKITFSCLVSDILEITNGSAPAGNKVIYMTANGNKIKSCFYKNDEIIKEHSFNNKQNIVLNKMSETEIESIKKLLVSLINNKGGNVKTNP